MADELHSLISLCPKEMKYTRKFLKLISKESSSEDLQKPRIPYIKFTGLIGGSDTNRCVVKVGKHFLSDTNVRFSAEKWGNLDKQVCMHVTGAFGYVIYDWNIFGLEKFPTESGLFAKLRKVEGDDDE